MMRVSLGGETIFFENVRDVFETIDTFKSMEHEIQRLRCVLYKVEQLLEPIASVGSAALALEEVRISLGGDPERRHESPDGGSSR